MLNLSLFRLLQNQCYHFSTVLIKTYWYTVSCKYSGCSGLTSVTIPNSVTSIGDGAFCGCSGLTSVTIPNSVTSIGSNAFLRCSGLKTITVAVDNRTYDSRNNCNAIIETATNKLITGCNNTSIPNSVTSIGSKAFYGCSGLTSVTIPNSVTSIGDWAFEDCSGLTSVTIGNSVATIGGGAFYNTPWFYNQPYGLIYAGLVAYKYKGTMPSGTRIEISEGTKSITGDCFNGCSGLTSVTIPNSVTSIGDGAFCGCSGLTSVTIPNSVTSIGNFVFYNCSDLTSVTIPNSIIAIGNYAFSRCGGLTSVTIPNSVTSIGNYAFSECSGLTSVNIDKSVSSVGNRAFNGCTSLTAVNISDLTEWCHISFYNAYSNPLYYAQHLFLNGTEVKNLVIPNSVTSIGNFVFFNCSGLTSVTIPNSVTSIGYSAFNSCSGLTGKLVIPNSATSISNYAFYKCSGLTSVNIGNSVTSIGYAAFSHCNGLTSVYISNSVISIEKWAFEGCSGLTSVTIPNSVTSIDYAAFGYCHGLKTVTVAPDNRTYDSRNNCNAIIETATNKLITGCKKTIIPKSVTTIGPGAFIGCSGLTSVTIPDSVTSIGGYAFYKCNGLTTIDSEIIHPSKITLGDSVFNGVPRSSCSLYVFEESLSEYQTTSPWKEFNIIAKAMIQLKADTIRYVRGTSNTVVELPIELVNYKTVSGLQFDMSLGYNMTFNLRNGVPDVWLEDSRKARNHTVAVERQSETSELYRVLVSSQTSQPLKGNSGVLLHANMQINKYGSAGLFPIWYSNITMAAPDETQYHQDPWQSYLSYEYVVGDANADTQVNVGDFAVTANKILNREVNSLYFSDAANVNQDGVVNVTDLVGIANIALGIRPTEIRRAPSMRDGQDMMHGQVSLHASTNDNQIAIALDNAVSIAGLQMDMVLPPGVTVAEAQLQGRAAGHDLQIATLPDGTVRLLVAAFSDRDIAAGDDTIMTLTLDGDIDGMATIGGTATERSLISHELDKVSLAMGMTDIDRLTTCNEVRIYACNGNIVIESPTDGTAQLVMLNGITRDLNVTAGRNTYPMESGYYVVRMAGATAKVKI